MGRPADNKGVVDESLTVHDNRTGKTYTIPITNNTVSATAFKGIAAPFKPDERVENETPKGLRVADKGFLNTAVIQARSHLSTATLASSATVATQLSSSLCTRPTLRHPIYSYTALA
ncbi:hypothetical protein EI94DRAFT_1898649 [Lactarius quietus]|nr:hypothetical protein EI94DRAFT_1898649 [Lactarius quietus]